MEPEWGKSLMLAIVKRRILFLCGVMMWRFIMTILISVHECLRALQDHCGYKDVWCLLSMVASPCLLAQVLHLQNKQVIVVSTTVVSLPPSAPFAQLCLCFYSCLLDWRYRVFEGFLSRLTCSVCPRTLQQGILAAVAYIQAVMWLEFVTV